MLTILVDNRLSVTCQHNVYVSKANCIRKCIRSGVSSRQRKAFMTLYFRRAQKSGHSCTRKLDTNL